MIRPNILLLYTDQQRFDTIAALGSGHMLTPNLDRLARRGTAFSRTYSSNPLCMPTRHDLITGVSARHHGYYENLEETPIRDSGLPTLPRLLAEAGYQTCAVGKMHFAPRREHHGFAHMYLMEELPASRQDDAYLQYLQRVGYGHVRCQHGVRPLFYHTPQVSCVPEEHHGSAWVAHKTIELIRQQRDGPFFIFCGWVGPHPPYYVPKKYLEMYRDRPLPPPCPTGAEGSRQCPISPEKPQSAELRLRRMREAYFAAVTLIDTHVGRILDALEESGQLAETLILFTSDHGEMLGDRGCYGKQIPYEGSAHVPLIACGQGFEAGAVCGTPVMAYDVAATILHAAGVDAPQGHPMPGISLLSAELRQSDRVVVFHAGTRRPRYVAAVDGRYKFIHWFNGGEEELYDLQSDPWEQKNLAGAASSEAVAEAGRLRKACTAFERDHGIAENVKDGEFVDLSYRPPAPHRCSLFPHWSYIQLPRWMNGHSQADLDAIAEQMRSCVRSQSAYICRAPTWRAGAVAAWQRIGGEKSVYEELFAAADRNTRSHAKE